MLGIPMGYLLKHPIAGVADLVADPIEIWTTILDSYVAERERRGPQCPYEPDLSWNGTFMKPSVFRGPAMRLWSFWRYGTR